MSEVVSSRELREVMISSRAALDALVGWQQQRGEAVPITRSPYFAALSEMINADTLNGEAIMECRRWAKQLLGVEGAFIDDVVVHCCHIAIGLAVERGLRAAWGLR